jgi:PAS domain S-box-containing protein
VSPFQVILALSTMLSLIATPVAVLAVLRLRRLSGIENRLHRQPQTESDLRKLMSQAPIGYHEIDRFGRFTFANAKEAELHGVTASELLGKLRWEFEPVNLVQRMKDDTLHKLAGTRMLVPYQRHLQSAGGAIFTVETHETLLYDASGKIAGLRAATIDITEPTRAQEEVRQTTSELKAIFQAFPDLFLRADAQGTILDYRSSKAAGGFGFAANCTGRHLRSALPELVGKRVEEAIQRAIQSEALVSVEYALPGPSAERFYEARIIPLHWQEVIIIVRDMTERKITEHQLERLASELTRKNAELVDALTAAREATKLKSQFLATMSHEIRTPMNGVLNMTEFLLNTRLSAEQREYAESVQSSAASLLGIINDILDLSKIEAGKLSLEHVDFDITGFVRDLSREFALHARGKQLKFDCRFDAEAPQWVRGDPGRLRQVLTNLLGNAIKFTARGEVSLRVEPLRDTGDTITFRFLVKDTGIGIRPEQSAHLFESFVQGDGSNTRKYGGTGLGLAISKQLVGMLGGEIGFESEPGQGSLFWATAVFEKRSAPVNAEPACEPVQSPGPAVVMPVLPPEPAPVTQVGHEPAHPPRGRILVAEDNPMNQKVAVRLLEKAGYQADVVPNGKLAVEAVRNRQYDLVLMDCQMPEMDGFEATAEIRREEGEGARHTAIVALTANAMVGDRERCLQAGMDDYLRKPFDLLALQRAIDNWVVQDRPGSKAEASVEAVPTVPRS